MDTSGFFEYPNLPSAEGTAAPGFLDDFGDGDWETLLSYTQTRRLRAGETVFAEGSLERVLYLISEGRIELASAKGQATTIEPPGPFGETAFLDGGRRTATARAVTNGELYCLGHEAMEALAVRDPHIAWRVMRDLGRIVAARLRAAHEA